MTAAGAGAGAARRAGPGSVRKEGFQKCRSATFSVDGYSFTIVANEAGDRSGRSLARFSRSKSQNCLWNSLIDGLTGNVKEKAKAAIIHDPRAPEEILADDLPQLDSPEALVKTSFRFGGLSAILFFSVRSFSVVLDALRGGPVIKWYPRCERRASTGRGPQRWPVWKSRR